MAELEKEKYTRLLESAVFVLWAKGYTQTQIAMLFKLTISRVRRIINKYR